MKKRVQRGLQLFAGMAVVLFLSACGGTSSNSHQNFVQQPPPVQQLAISTTSLPNGTQGQAYSVTLQASGGTGSDTWRVVNGLLPDDLSLNPGTGVISGIPATAQTATFTVQARDSSASPQTSTQQLTLTIGAAPLSISTSLLPAASVNQAYQVTLATGGGVNPFAWTLTSGILPPGLLLLNDGRIIGIATTTGAFNFTVRVQDGTPSTVTRSLALQIVPSGVRNDTVANATAISNGVVRASISPYGDSSMATDTDYYRLTAAPGAVVKVELLPAGPIDHWSKLSTLTVRAFRSAARPALVRFRQDVSAIMKILTCFRMPGSSSRCLPVPRRQRSSYMCSIGAEMPDPTCSTTSKFPAPTNGFAVGFDQQRRFLSSYPHLHSLPH